MKRQHGKPSSATSFVELVGQRAREQPQDLAYMFLVDGEESDQLTFAEIERQARVIGARLQQHGASGERVLLLYPPGLAYIAAFYGCLYAGAVAVPAYPPRSNRHLPRLRSIIADAQPRVSLTNGAIYSQVHKWFDTAPELQSMHWSTTDVLEIGEAEEWQDPRATRDTLAMLQYTSGSTAAPKGVMVSHGNLLYNEELMRTVLGHDDDSVIVSWLPLYHDMGLIGNVLAGVYNGIPCHLMAPVDFLRKPLRWLEAVTRYKATFSGGPDFAYALCVEKIPPEDRERLDLRSWRGAFNGSEPVHEETLHHFAETFEPHGFRREAMFPCYGLAEYTLMASGRFHTRRSVAFSRSALENDHMASPAAEGEHSKTLVSCGAVLPEQRIAVVDPQTKEECVPGEIGEIWLSSPSVAQGYWNKPEASWETFQASLEPSGEGPFLRTGDLGFLYNGEVYITGRHKDLIIIRGRNIYPQDIEVTAEKCHPALAPSFVSAFSVEMGGVEHLGLAAEVQRQYRNRLDVEEVVERIRSAVAAEHSVNPALIALLRPGSLPKTSSGKRQRSKARQGLLDEELPLLGEWRDDSVFPAPAESPEGTQDWTADELQSWLIGRLAKRLKIAPERIDVDRSIASFGLESVAAAGLTVDIEERLNVDFPVDLLFDEEPTPRQIVNLLWQKLGGAPLEPPQPVREEPIAVAAPEIRRSGVVRLTSYPKPDASWHSFRKFVNPEIGRLLQQLSMDKTFVSGEGCYLYDREGHRYLDFLAQYGALPFGFNPPRVWAALNDLQQRAEPSFVQPSALDPAGTLAERLLASAPPGLRFVTFSNSGAEAVEAAIKLSRSATQRTGILATKDGFHGKTMGALSATARAKYQRPFGVPVAGFDYVPYGDLEALEEAVATRRYAAFMVEPLQGEGGIVEPPPGYLRAAWEACKRSGTLFVADEIQTGLGRTGAMYACSTEGVTPDIMTLAKALGGGLMPIGACLSTADVYNEDFGLHHSSTFAGNALACRAGIATLDLLEENQGELVRQVADNGVRLKQGLLELRRRYPEIIDEVRGRGYFLGIKFGIDRTFGGDGLLGYLGEQDALTALVVSHLLNFERVRVGYTLNRAKVMRIEPPLIATWEDCQVFLEAFERVLEVLESRDLARLTAHITGLDPAVAEPAEPAPPASGVTVGEHTRRPRLTPNGSGHFAFLVHPLSLRDYGDLDPSLSHLSTSQLERLSTCFADNFDPFVISETKVRSATNQTAYGEFIVLPRTAEELQYMPQDEALAEVRLAAEVARDRGAKILGLGAYSSVVTQSGLALRSEGMPALTTGNSFTVATARKSIQLALRERGWDLSDKTVTVLGAGGAIGRAIAVLLSEGAGRLVLVGNPAHPLESLRRLQQVAGEVLWVLQRVPLGGFPGGPLAREVTMLSATPSPTQNRSVLEYQGAAWLENSRLLEISVDTDRWLPETDLVVTATSSVARLVKADKLKRDAVVCDISRPSNVSLEVRQARPDVLVIDGGVVTMPGGSVLGFKSSLREGQAYACMAETMLLALEQRYQDSSLGHNLKIETILDLERLGDKHGFETLLADGVRETEEHQVGW